MSAYRVHESKVKTVAAILAALVDRIVQQKLRGLSEENIAENVKEWTDAAKALVKESVEIYEEPVNLVDYQGNVRNQKANVIFRRQFVDRYLGGGASNDLGFLQGEDASFEAVVSVYDEFRWWNTSSPRFWQAAMAHEAAMAAVAAGYQIHRSEEHGNIKLVAVLAGTGGQSSHGGAW